MDEPHHSDELTRRVAELERGHVMLFGYGERPGWIETTQTNLEKHNERVAVLERAYWKLIGAGVLAGSFTGIIVLAISKLWH
jgi:hypothetical protein